MKNLFAIIVLLSVSAFAQAGLILHISEDISGGTRWEFSGSTTALTSGNSNSFWGYNSGTLAPSYQGSASILSGSGFLSSTSFGQANVINTWASSHTFAGISPRVSSITWSAGDVLSWSGDLVSTTSFASLNLGSITTNRINHSSVDNITESLTITIANTSMSQQVPEPSILVLMGFSLLGLFGVNRRKIKQA